MRSLMFVAVCGLVAVVSAQETTLTDWEFRKENETAWRKVAVPHDWAVEATPVKGLCPHQGDLPFVGKGFYRRALDGFTPPDGGRVYLDFDGVMCRSEIFLNGKKVGGTPFGYTSEVVDVTDALKGAGNLLEVTAENVPASSRWYPGSGIFREVKARVVPRDHVKPRTLFIRTLDANERLATVAVSFEWTGGASNFTFTVAQPRLWSPETPHLYELELFGETFRYGIRTATFDPQKGFFLNGRHRQMRGVCLHHDLGPIGARFDRTFARRQLALLKEMGCDAIRTSHNPPAAALLDLCDEMGVLVMDEAFDMWERPKGDYAKFFKAWHERDLTELVRRDRSHPSVVMWSIGNELSEFNDADGKDAIRIATALTAIVKREDATRPVTFGSWKPEPMDNGCQDTVDAFGANYLPFRYAAFSAKHPTVGLVGTETCSTVSSRGEYFFPVVASPIASEGDLARRRNEGRERMVRGAQMSGYDLWGPHQNDYPPDVEFEYQEKNPQVYGEFVWTGFDYIGEPDPCAKSGGRLSYFGIFDLCGFAKDRYWLYKAQWRPEVPSAHILPHWNWSPSATSNLQPPTFNLPIHVYSSGDEAELFVNGVSQGRKTRGRYQYRFVWDDVKYEPGEVSVKTWKKGQPWAEDRIVTAGEPAKVVVEEERDFPGFYRRYIESETGAKAMFVQGAAGNLVPKEDELGLGGAQRTGEELAKASVFSIISAQRCHARFAMSRPRVGATSRTFTTRLRKKLRDKLKRETHTFEIQCLAIGDICFVGVPGETVCEIGLEIKWHSPFRRAFIGYVATGYYDYIVTENQLVGGGYEAQSQRFAVRDSLKLVETARDAMFDLHSKLFPEDDLGDDPYPDNLNPPIVNIPEMYKGSKYMR